MKNTGIVYHSTERTPTVLAELAGLLPPLSGEQLAALEADLLQNGCRPVFVAAACRPGAGAGILTAAGAVAGSWIRADRILLVRLK